MVMLTARRYFSAEGIDVDPEAECAFFSSLKMRNGTFKLTRLSRFAAVEEAIRPIIRERAGSIGQVLDVGASSGLTTIELVDFLQAEGASPRVIGTDLFVKAHLVEISPRLHVLADDEGWPLQYDLAGRPLRAWVRRLDYFTLTFVPLLLGRAVLRGRLAREIAEGRSMPVRMECQALAGRNIKLVENDILVATPEFVRQFDLIRAANILNLGYFRAERIRTAIANIFSYCRGPGSLLLVVRSHGQDHHGSLFELLERGDVAVRARIGKGSEIEPLILGRTSADGGRRA
ncbi:ATP-binding protein [Chelativorans xinjiangense]|uniref:ATP-binding protein n=1 Tax=Chelativorans xinjiangense TaxID=2681485 RepID=UPI001FE3B0FE|nr:ATP-binding protein [Chelativorans xinjiangense]